MAPRLHALHLPFTSPSFVFWSLTQSLRAHRLSDLHTSNPPLLTHTQMNKPLQGFPAAHSLVGKAAEKNNIGLVWTLQV